MRDHEIGAMHEVSECQVSKLLATQIKPNILNEHNSRILSATSTKWHHGNVQHFTSLHQDTVTQATAK